MDENITLPPTLTAYEKHRQRATEAGFKPMTEEQFNTMSQVIEADILEAGVLHLICGTEAT
jgi:hypothetical protein